MKLPVYQIDAFAGRVFAGNPAVVCLLEAWLDDAVLTAIAAEHNISTTAFLVGSVMALAASLVIWVFLDVKHEELATDGPEMAHAGV